MTDLQNEVKAARLTRAKVSILGFVNKAGCGYRYLNATRFAVPWPTDEEFDAAVTLLTDGGLVFQTEGRDGGVRLQKVEQPKEATQNG
jgi:hypothetical protein